jgi:restriction system protein
VSRLFMGGWRYQKKIEKAEIVFAERDQIWLRDFEAAYKEWHQANEDFETKKVQRNAEVEEFMHRYIDADPEAVSAYTTMVLERSSYPDDFPHEFEIAYVPASRQVVVEYELPGYAVIPAVSAYRYIKSRDAIEEKSRRNGESVDLYRDVVAAVSLRTIHEIFESDVRDHIDTVCLNGYVSTVDRATGRDINPHLISVRATKGTFLQLDLARVDKKICLKNLGAHVSANPEEAVAVKPIVEFDMVDRRFVDQADVLNVLESRPNLLDLNPYEFEHLVANLFGQMGLESKLTRSSKDGGVDCVAFDSRPVLGGKVVIQAKRYKNVVGVSAVRDLYGTMMNEGANKGILVTTSGYGPDAYEFCKDKPIELIDGGGLLYLLEQIGFKARILVG